ncbi:MAG: hypothetical protein JXR96_06465 [Deltaproteobacteria bacterium]|nr:hypothetical protein [Deltaproteobacteria bacterium]
MALELKLESLRARGELSAEERDRLVAGLRSGPGEARPPRRLLTPLRLFLLGVACGVGLAQIAWMLFR